MPVQLIPQYLLNVFFAPVLDLNHIDTFYVFVSLIMCIFFCSSILASQEGHTFVLLPAVATEQGQYTHALKGN